MQAMGSDSFDFGLSNVHLWPHSDTAVSDPKRIFVELPEKLERQSWYAFNSMLYYSNVVGMKCAVVLTTTQKILLSSSKWEKIIRQLNN